MGCRQDSTSFEVTEAMRTVTTCTQVTVTDKVARTAVASGLPTGVYVESSLSMPPVVTTAVLDAQDTKEEVKAYDEEVVEEDVENTE